MSSKDNDAADWNRENKLNQEARAELIEFTRKIVAQCRSELGGELLRRLRKGEEKVSFDDPEVKPFLIDLKIAERLLEYVERALEESRSCFGTFTDTAGVTWACRRKVGHGGPHGFEKEENG